MSYTKTGLISINMFLILSIFGCSTTGSDSLYKHTEYSNTLSQAKISSMTCDQLDKELANIKEALNDLGHASNEFEGGAESYSHSLKDIADNAEPNATLDHRRANGALAAMAIFGTFVENSKRDESKELAKKLFDKGKSIVISKKSKKCN